MQKKGYKVCHSITKNSVFTKYFNVCVFFKRKPFFLITASHVNWLVLLYKEDKKIFKIMALALINAFARRLYRYENHV